MAKRRFRGVDQPPSSEEWRAIHRAADAAAPEVQRSFLTAVEKARTRVANRARRLIQQGDFIGASRLVRDTFRDAVEEWDIALSLRAPLEGGARATAEVLTENLSVSAIRDAGTIRFDVANPRALEYVDREAARLIVDLTDQEERRIAQIISSSFREGFTTRTTSRLIKDGIGLTRFQEGALMKFEQDLVDSGLSASRVLERVETRREQMLLRRSRLIARQETMAASNQGTQVMWEQASANGQIPSTIKRKWILTPDDRLCPICRGIPLNEFKGINEPFVSTFNGQETLTPPMHIGCRCTLGLVRVSLSAVA